MKKIASLTLALAALGACLFPACGSASEAGGAAFTAYLGSPFVLPFDGEVTDKNGNKIPLNGGAFTPTDTDGYYFTAGGRKYAIEVKKNKPLTIATEFSEKYFIYESGAAAFPTVEVSGGVGAITKQYRLYKGETPYYYADGAFIPDETGDYTLKVTATDDRGNSATATTVYHVVEEGDDRSNAIAVFDSETGVDHFTNVYGFKAPEFTEEMAFGGERGSTKLQISSEHLFGQSFQLTNLFDTYISDDLGVYFNIYNAGAKALTIWINWSYSFQLQPGRWNEIYLDNIDESQWSNNDIFADYITSENIDGLYFEMSHGLTGSDNATLYFSNFYKIPLYGADRFNRIIENAEVTDDTAAHYKALTRAYHLFSSLEKKRIHGFTEKVEEKLWRYYEEKYTSVYTEHKLVDFNSGLWSEQASVKGAKAQYLPAAEAAPNAKDGETGVTELISGNDSYSVSVTIDMPTVSRYSSVEQNADLNYIYGGFGFSVYCPVIAGCEVYASVNGSYTTLDQGEWNELWHDHGNKKLRGNNIQFYLCKKTQWDTPFPEGTTFKISSIYGKLKPTASILNGYLAQLEDMTDEEILTSDLSQNAFEAYRNMNYDQRNATVGYKEFVERFSLALIPETERIAGVRYAFNTEKGLKQISMMDGFATYTTEKRYGLNTGSLLVTPDAKRDPWSIYVYLNAPTLVDYSPAYCYVWVEGSAPSYQISLGHPLDNSMYAKTRTVLTKGAWTKLSIPVTTHGLIGCNLTIATKDWSWRIPDDTKYYISPIYFEQFVGDSEVPEGENELPFVPF